MKTIVKLIGVGCLLGATVACHPVDVREPAYGPNAYPAHGEWDGGIRNRVSRARTQIDHGIRDGSLTRHEARDLQAQLDEVIRRIDYMKRDGHLSRSERERIDSDLDRLERNIRRERNDNDRRR